MKEYTSEERWYTAGICFVVILLSILISSSLIKSSVKKIDNYESAVRITDNTQFEYAVRTQYSGGLFGTGNVTMNPVSDLRLSQEYGRIIDYQEEYTRHTRNKCISYKDGKCTATVVEVYYEWDSDGSTVSVNPSLKFMDTEFNTNQLSIDFDSRLPLNSDTVSSSDLSKISWNYLYDDGIYFNSVGDTRHYFYVLPTTFNATMFIRSTSNGYINAEDKPCGCELVNAYPDDIIKSARSSLNLYRFLPILIPFFVLIGCVLYFTQN